MSQTMAQQAIETTVHEHMEDPEWASIIAGTLAKMRKGFWSQAYIDVVLQKYARFGRYDIYDAYAFAVSHTYINTGEWVRIEVSVGSEPVADRKHDEMNRILQDGLPSIFSAEFWGGTQDEDGSFSWKEPVLAERIIINDDVVSRFYGYVPPMSVPLEVGYTSGAKTLTQMGLGIGLARWAYNSTTITVLLKDNPQWTWHPVDNFQHSLFDYANGLCENTL